MWPCGWYDCKHASKKEKLKEVNERVLLGALETEKGLITFGGLWISSDSFNFCVIDFSAIITEFLIYCFQTFTTARFSSFKKPAAAFCQQIAIYYLHK